MPGPDRRSRHHRHSLWPLAAALVLLVADYALIRTLALDRVMLLARGQRGTARVVERNSQFTREPKALYGHMSYTVTYAFQVREQGYGHRQAVSERDYAAMRKGAEVEIIYDPRNPRNSALAGSVGPLSVAFTAVILLAANGGAVLVWRARSRTARGSVARARRKAKRGG